MVTVEGGYDIEAVREGWIGKKAPAYRGLHPVEHDPIRQRSRGTGTMANASKAEIEAGGSYLPEPVAVPVIMNDDLDRPFHEGVQRNELWVQYCTECESYQWGPEWICHKCLSYEVEWRQVESSGRIYSWERIWHPVHPVLGEAVPYVVALVELPHADNIRMVGNLLGEPEEEVVIGSEVEAVFEHHADADPAFTLVQWSRV